MTVAEQIEYLQRIVDKDKNLKYEPFVVDVMKQDKSALYKKRLLQIANPIEYMNEGQKKQLEVNPNASNQMRGLWKSLGLESDVLTGAKEESFSTPVLKELLKTTSDDTSKEIIQQVLDISSTKNLLAQYIPAYEMNYDGKGGVYQSVKAPGTSSYRLSGKSEASGNGISMVTQPGVTKRAVVAPKGFVICTSDFANLEGYVGSMIQRDAMKQKVLLQKYDSHCLHTGFYFTHEVEAIMQEPFNDSIEYNMKMNALRKVNKELDKLRSDSKGVTFGITYGAYPPKIAKTLKQPLAVGEKLFNRFHNDLYPDSRDYKDKYILPTAKAQGYIHQGLGARIHSKNPEKDVRTLGNSTMQFWSILTLLAIVKVKKRIELAGYAKDIFIYGTIHDSINAYVREDPSVLKWYNDTLIECMVQDFLIDQKVTLQSNVDIGYSYANCVELPNNCSEQHIIDTLNSLK